MRPRWHDVLKQSLRTQKQLEEFFQTSFPALDYPVLVPLALAKKIREQGLDSPLAKQFLPHADETLKGGLRDPIGDTAHSPAPQVVHRYHSRALLLPTTVCPVICRYCFRKNELYGGEELFIPRLSESLQYFRDHPEIEEVILSGGDPLMLSDAKLAELIRALSEIKSIKYLRFHSRFLPILPERFNHRLKRTLKSSLKYFSRVTFVIHSNLAEEWGPSALKKLAQLRSLGIDLRLQSVLLRGVNDCPTRLLELIKLMIEHGVTPYYLHHPDQAQGTQHFQLELEAGRRLYAQLRDCLPGWAIPRYTLDIPGGEGKVEAFNPESYKFSGKLINRLGNEVGIKGSQI